MSRQSESSEQWQFIDMQRTSTQLLRSHLSIKEEQQNMSLEGFGIYTTRKTEGEKKRQVTANAWTPSDDLSFERRPMTKPRGIPQKPLRRNIKRQIVPMALPEFTITHIELNRTALGNRTFMNPDLP
jgi:hypothetical protein